MSGLPPVVADPSTPLAVPCLARMELHVFRAPIETPVRTSFGLMRDRPAVLVRIEDGDGAFGWGEIWSNFPACGAEHRARLAATALAPRLLDRAFASPVEASEILRRETRILALQTREHGPLDQAAAGIDGALWDLVARRAGRPLWELLGGGSGAGVPVYASGINPGAAVETVARARAEGYRAFKVKIGFDPDRDLAVARSVSEELGAGERFMLDANQAWDPAAAAAMARRLAETGPAWLEEALPADSPAAAWHQLASQSPVPLAGGENLASTEAFAEAIDDGRWQVVQPDLCKWGGPSLCVPLARQALRAARRYCPHFLGGGIGLLASAHALAAVGGDGLLEVDVNPNPLREALARPYPPVAEGSIDLPPGPGLGVEPDLEAARPWRTLHLSERA